ncbi:hypothetical protein KYK29_00155 [Shinella daejeonensis]|nr:hypothetical protein [Shinella daejeonensis]
MTQSFLHAGEDRLVVACFEIDDPIGRKTGLRESGGEEIRPSDAPQDFAGRPGRYASREQSSGGAVDSAVSAASDFMKSPPRQASARESRVYVGDPEGEHRFRAPALAFDPFDLRAQRLYGGLGPQVRS